VSADVPVVADSNKQLIMAAIPQDNKVGQERRVWTHWATWLMYTDLLSERKCTSSRRWTMLIANTNVLRFMPQKTAKLKPVHAAAHWTSQQLQCSYPNYTGYTHYTT
jgi:hypothetical protein